MFKKLLFISLSAILIAFNVNAGSDGELILKKNQPADVKDCFEKLNRVTFALIKLWMVLYLSQLQVSIKNYLHQ